MDSIRIDTGGVRLMVNGDPQRVIAFNPHDVVFAERFYALLGEFKGAEQDFWSVPRHWTRSLKRMTRDYP